MLLTDNILALSSPGGAGGLRAILRLSGPAAWRHVREISDLAPSASRGWHDVQISLPGLAPFCAAVMLFETPRSFTGHDIAELHLPNSPAILRLAQEALLAAAGRLSLPLRQAEPGEFSARAFLNGKLDLTQAEGIAATINAASASQLRAAAGLRGGDLHHWLAATAENLATILALVEAGIDFVEEEDVTFITAADLAAKLLQLTGHIQKALAESVRIDRLDDLPAVVFVGKPNVGKSSLINALAGHERSIVSPVAGTTRDMLSVTMTTSRGPVRLIDVPGEEAPADELLAKMMETRKNALLDADLVVEVFDHEQQASGTAESGFSTRCIAVQNKADLLTTDDPTRTSCQLVSAKTGFHVNELREAIGAMASRDESIAAGRLVLNHRHRALLQQSLEALTRACDLAASELNNHPELLAAELREALDLLGQITGAISPDEILGRIFSQFCIGK